MTGISRGSSRQYPEDDKGWGAVLMPLREDTGGRPPPVAPRAAGAVGFVLLIRGANVANLVLVRTLARRRELAVRLALGAGPWRVIRQVLTETTLLALLGGGLGLLSRMVGVRLITSFFGDRLPRAVPIHADGRVLIFTAIVALFTGLAAGPRAGASGCRAPQRHRGHQAGGGRADL